MLGGGTSIVLPLSFCIKPDKLKAMDNLNLRIDCPPLCFLWGGGGRGRGSWEIVKFLLSILLGWGGGRGGEGGGGGRTTLGGGTFVMLPLPFCIKPG